MFKVDWPKNPYEDYDEFYEWFITTIKNNLQVPVSKFEASKRPSSFAKYLPKFSDKDRKYVYSKIREHIALPSDVFLRYNANYHTIYSYWDKRKGVYRISINTPVGLSVAHLPILKTGISHELGHIFNGDCLNADPCHKGCANVCADVRINAAFGDEASDRLYSVIQMRKTAKCPFVPSRWYPKYNLPVNDAGWPFEIAHNHYHMVDKYDDCNKRPKEDTPKQKQPELPEPEYYKELPDIGDFVQVGDDFGFVIGVDAESRDVEVYNVTRERVFDILSKIKKGEDVTQEMDKLFVEAGEQLGKKGYQGI
jgi:hypothetical protein